MQVCLNFIPTQNSTQKPLVVGYEKEGKNIKCLGKVSYTFERSSESFEELTFYLQNFQTSRRKVSQRMNDKHFCELFYPATA